MEVGTYPFTRMRRLRSSDFVRRLVRENVLQVDDLIYPLFVTEGIDVVAAIPSMPDVQRLSRDRIIREAKEAYRLGSPPLRCSGGASP